MCRWSTPTCLLPPIALRFDCMPADACSLNVLHGWIPMLGGPDLHDRGLHPHASSHLYLYEALRQPHDEA